MDKKFEYFAFISYKRRDSRTAKRLQRWLEYYRLPLDVRKNDTRLKKGIRPVFKDTTDLTPGRLHEEIERALDNSRYLIVVCSPDAAKSKWVNKEVQYFIDHGRADDIIPYIIGGEPNSADPRKECYPESLRALSGKREILGANVAENGRRAAAVKVVARMFGLRFDTLWQRHRRRLMIQRIAWSVIGAVLLGAGILAFDFFRTKREYYADMTYRYGMPHGIERLDVGHLDQVPSYFVFLKSRGKLRRVEYRSFQGIIDLPADERESLSPVLELDYDGGRLGSITRLDAFGKPFLKELFVSDDMTKVDLKEVQTGDAAAVFKSSTSVIEGFSNQGFDINTFFLTGKAQVARYVYVYDDNGFVLRRIFKRHNGSNETGRDNNGICGMEYERNDAGQVTRVLYLDEDNNNMVDRNGIAGAEFTYDDHGFNTSLSYFGSDKEAKSGELAFALARATWNPETHTYAVSYFGEDEEPVLSSFFVHCIVTEYFPDSTILNYYGLDGTPTNYFNTINQDGGYEKAVIRHNSAGYPISFSYYNAASRPVIAMAGYHSVDLELDEGGRPVRTRTLGTDGKPINVPAGFSRTDREYDAYGNVVVETYYDAFDRRVNMAAGFSQVRYGFDGPRLRSISYYDLYGFPAYPASNTFSHRVELSYDDNGNIRQTTFTDPQLKPCKSPGVGFATLKLKYDNGRCVYTECLDENDKRITNSSGYAITRFEYDERGNNTRCATFDADDRLVVNPESGVADTRYVCDKLGNIVEVSYLGADGLPVRCMGAEVVRNEYQGKLLSAMSAFNADGTPAKFSVGAHRIENAYDERNMHKSVRYFDENGDPALSADGCGSIDYTTGKAGMRTSTTYRGLDGNPVDISVGYAVEKTEFNDFLRPVRTEYFHADGSRALDMFGVAIVENTYDSRGNNLLVAYYGADGEPVKHRSNRYQRMESRFNDSGQMIYLAFYDADGLPVDSSPNNGVGPLLFAKYVCDYDADGRPSFEVYFDSDGDVVNIATTYVENGVVEGYLNRQLFGSSVILTRLDGSREEYGPLDSTPESRRAYEYIDSISNLAKSKL